MNEFECRFCLNKVKSYKNECTCTMCGRKMHIIPYDRKQELQNELVSYYQMPQFKLDSKFVFTEVKEMIDTNSFPNYENIYKMAISKKESGKYISLLRTTLESLEQYLLNDLTSRTNISFGFIMKKTSQFDKVLLEMLKEIDLEFHLNTLNFPNIIAELHYQKNSNLKYLIKHTINNLEELIEKMSNHIDLYNIDISENTNVKKFAFADNVDAITILENINIHLKKITYFDIAFDLLSDGIDEFSKMNNAFWLALFALLKYAKPSFDIKYLYDGENISIIDKINLLFDERYSDLNLKIKEKILKKSIEELMALIEVFVEKNISSILNIPTASFIPIGKTERKLNSLIGLKEIKLSIEKIKAYSVMNKNSNDLNLHMCFLGNPGTGKTEVARLIADILYENKILPTNKVIETDRSGLVSSYLGDTVNKTNKLISNAMGGVLFIDEAYSLVSSDSIDDYGHEAVATLIKAMEDNRGKFCVILAGYKNPMMKMIETNPGFKSRIQFTLDFPDYSREEIRSIFNIMLEKKGYAINDTCLDKVLDIIDVKRRDKNFANAREARNILMQLIMNQNIRTMDSNNKIIILEDINKYIIDYKVNVPTNDNNKKSRILTPEEELESLIGLVSVKKMIKKIKAYAKKNKDDNLFNMHMCFYGNPGTGKTEVARIMSRLLYECGILPEAKFIETDKTGLIGKYIGETESKTKELIDSAIGGVLFIDEAYALYDSRQNGYGQQALDVLLKEMEDKRGKFCLILAGYKMEMKDLISSNPGFASRIAFELDFPDFTREELTLICERMISKKHYTIESNVTKKIIDIIEYYKNEENFANARTLRNVIDQVIMNQNLRTEYEANNEIIINDVLDYIDEENILLDTFNNQIDNKKTHNDEIFMHIIKNDIMTLHDMYRYIDINMINNEYINETIVSIFGNNSQGTGFIISPSGLCVSCNHCLISSENNYKVRLNLKTFDHKTINMYSNIKIICRDEKNDIAVFKIISSSMIYKFLPLADKGYEYKPLLSFYTAGYPFGGETFENISFSEGQVASVNDYNNRKLVFADMFGKSGSSGSPILDKARNNVVGIYCGGISYNDKTEMINCFTPVDFIWDLLKSIL